MLVYFTKTVAATVCLCSFRSYWAHFNCSQPRCCLFAAVIAIDVVLKSFIIIIKITYC